MRIVAVKEKAQAEAHAVLLLQHEVNAERDEEGPDRGAAEKLQKCLSGSHEKETRDTQARIAGTR